MEITLAQFLSLFDELVPPLQDDTVDLIEDAADRAAEE